MALKRKKRAARKDFSEMSEKDWEKWGDRFGKHMEHWGEGFGKKGKRMEEKFERDARGHWWHVMFGPVGPLLQATFAIICLVILGFLFGLAGSLSKIALFTNIAVFFYANVQWFFLAYLVFDYARYLKYVNCAIYWPVKPLVTGVRAAFSFWIIAFVLGLFNDYLGSDLLATVSSYINANLLGIFVLFAVFGYAALFMMKGMWCCCGKK